MAAPKAATVNELLERNKAIAKTHEPLPTLTELGAMNIEAPHTMIVTCADPRCVPEKIFNLQPTDGAVVFRNVGGHVANSINDIAALDVFMTINDLMIIHHTDCGTTHFTDEGIREGLKKRLPGREAEIEGMAFGAQVDLAQSVREDIEILKKNPFIRKELADRAVGFVFDIKTGELTPVSA